MATLLCGMSTGRHHGKKEYRQAHNQGQTPHLTKKIQLNHHDTRVNTAVAVQPRDYLFGVPSASNRGFFPHRTLNTPCLLLVDTHLTALGLRRHDATRDLG